jgi:hypothetical protein
VIVLIGTTRIKHLRLSVLDFGPQIKSIQIKSKSGPDFDLDFKIFFMHGFGFGFDLKYCLKSKSNPNPFMKISLADVASKLRPETHSFSLFELFLIF